MVRAPVMTFLQIQAWLCTVWPFLAHEQGLLKWKMATFETYYGLGRVSWRSLPDVAVYNL